MHLDLCVSTRELTTNMVSLMVANRDNLQIVVTSESRFLSSMVTLHTEEWKSEVNRIDEVFQEIIRGPGFQRLHYMGSLPNTKIAILNHTVAGCEILHHLGWLKACKS